MLNVVIFGHSGFLGKNIVRRLNNSNKYKIFLFSKSNGFDLTKKKSINMIIKSLKNHQDLVIINCAAHVGGIRYGINHPLKIFKINQDIISGLYDIYDKLYKNINKIINPISACIYPKEGKNFREVDIMSGMVDDSVFSYAVSRYSLISMMKGINIERNINYINLVLPNLYGKGDHIDPEKAHAFSALYNKIKFAKENNINHIELWGTGKPIREWMHVDDASSAIIHIITKNNNSFDYNVSSNSSLTIIALANKIKQALKWNGKIVLKKEFADGAMVKTINGKKFTTEFKWSPSFDIARGIKSLISNG